MTFSTFLPLFRRRFAAASTVVAGCAALLAGGLPAATAASPDAATPPGRTVAHQDPCPEPFPLDEVTEGMSATGRTVEKGTEPEPFTATVVGVVDGGISPDLDLIIVETSSPAIDRAGGIWAGMSGSPVYTDDGRLLGAVAYGLSAAPSNIAGLTPAAAIHDLSTRSAVTATGSAHDAAAAVELPEHIQGELVASSVATASEVRSGMRVLPVPMAVSGLSASRLDSFSERLGERLPEARAFPAGAARTDAEGSADEIVPGGNFAAALSYGDVTAAGIGTTTTVCEDSVAVAFGHPYLWSGSSSMSVHPASAVFVQRDDAMGSYKVANPGGVVGTLDQDRLAGIRGKLGEGPAVVPVTSSISPGGADGVREGRTEVTMADALPDLASSHALANLDAVFDAVGPGTAHMGWLIDGVRASGEPFTVEVENMYASRYDIAFDAVFDSFDQILAIQENEFEEVEILAVEYTGSVSDTFQRYTVSSVQVRQDDGEFAPPPASGPLQVKAGGTVDVHVTLLPYQGKGDTREVELSVEVPDDAAGAFGWFSVSGGPSKDVSEEPGEEAADGATDENAGFDELLTDLEDLLPNNTVTATLHVEEESEDGFELRQRSDRVTVDHVATGHHEFSVAVSP
ncbi:hypothetical protein G1H11_18810 [Phytoactinopolyspora alkaliphila]|uniref:Peptidase S55 domain-containing protein n=1 Tax=Phytoactinopolyspora alkaliphila TaxID=1783498 RepID=A0A6N9YQU1_9ACTN|nr:SpoIVB peptidase S55 domain-containing protein [Phytoactinopolyspora alkaliphila]NED97352.1 hypothetical protein [Phytoactinopolyspora alkaliphila]